MAKSRRVKAVEAQKSSGKENAKKQGTSTNMAGKVLKSKNAKLPVKTINKKEIRPTPSQPKNIERTFKLEVRRSMKRINRVIHEVKVPTSSSFM